MAFIKEDGSLDVERINNLPIEEYMDVVGDLTEEQFEYFLQNQQLNESKEPVEPIEVDYDFDDERSGRDIGEYLDKMKKKIGIK